MANRRMVHLEDAFWQHAVLGVSNAGTAADGNRYIVGAAPTGAFSGFTTHDIATYAASGPYTGTPEWIQDTPVEGWRVHNLDTDTVWLFDGTAWVDTGEPMQTVPLATEDNLASFDDAGQVKDSGVGTPEYVPALGVIVQNIPDPA